MIARITLALAVATGILAGGIGTFADASGSSRAYLRPLAAGGHTLQAPSCTACAREDAPTASTRLRPAEAETEGCLFQLRSAWTASPCRPNGKRILLAAKTPDKRTAVATADLDGTHHRVLRLPDATLNLGPGIRRRMVTRRHADRP